MKYITAIHILSSILLGKSNLKRYIAEQVKKQETSLYIFYVKTYTARQIAKKRDRE